MEGKSAGSAEYGRLMVRLARALGVRAREGRASLDTLTQLQELQALLDEQLAEVVSALRSEVGGAHSWAEIGSALGITRQAAAKRFGPSDDAARKPGGQPAHRR